MNAKNDKCRWMTHPARRPDQKPLPAMRPTAEARCRFFTHPSTATRRG